MIICSFFILLASCASEGEKDEGKGAKKAGVDQERAEKKGNKKENPWESEDIMEPERLAEMLEDSSADLPLIHCVGPHAIIPHSEHFGETQKDSAIAVYREHLSDIPKDRSLVFYCGCCPFKDCPNIRPAFRLLEGMGFEDFKLLGLRTSLKADWLDHNFPTVSETEDLER